MCGCGGGGGGGGMGYVGAGGALPAPACCGPTHQRATLPSPGMRQTTVINLEKPSYSLG